MEKYDEENVLCASSSYDKKYYFNPRYSRLPENVQKELQITSVLFTEDVGGIFVISFDSNGEIHLESSHREDDILYDDVGAGLKLNQLQMQRNDLWEPLSKYYRGVFMGQNI